MIDTWVFVELFSLLFHMFEFFFIIKCQKRKANKNYEIPFFHPEKRKKKLKICCIGRNVEEHFCRLLVGSMSWYRLFGGNFGKDIFFDPTIPLLEIYHTDYPQTHVQVYMNKDIHHNIVFITKDWNSMYIHHFVVHTYSVACYKVWKEILLIENSFQDALLSKTCKERASLSYHFASKSVLHTVSVQLRFVEINSTYFSVTALSQPLWMHSGQRYRQGPSFSTLIQFLRSYFPDFTDI